MHKCSICKKEIGAEDNPPLYAFEGNDHCKKCMDQIDIGWRRSIDTAVAKNTEYKKRVIAGTYMNPREDANGYGK